MWRSLEPNNKKRVFFTNFSSLILKENDSDGSVTTPIISQVEWQLIKHKRRRWNHFDFISPWLMIRTLGIGSNLKRTLLDENTNRYPIHCFVRLPFQCKSRFYFFNTLVWKAHATSPDPATFFECITIALAVPLHLSLNTTGNLA